MSRVSRGKRPAVSDSDEDAASDTTSSPPHSSSHVGSDGRKRRRISDNSDTTPEQDHDGASGRASLEDPDTDEEDLDSESAEAEAEAQATQALNERQNRDHNQGNVAREAGVLKLVEVHDFMCHHYCRFDVGPLINFVCGRNGSGKSAILTAIILCLGGKVTHTNRAGKLASLIKQGCDVSRIICTIRNKGEDAYKPEDYGDVVVVERHFSKTGTSGYKIRSASGRLVSTKKAELDAVVDHFNLQIENPLNVLSQDKARSFLQSSNPAEKYKFFIKGVQLETLDQDYKIIEEQLGQMKEKLKRKEEEIDDLRKIAEERQQEKLAVEKRDGLRDRMRDLRRQAVWCQVRDQERNVDRWAGDIAEADQKISEAQNQVDGFETRFQEADAAYEASKVESDETAAALLQAQEATKEVSVAMAEAKAEMQAAQGEVRDVRTAIKNHEKAIENTQSAIEQEEQRLLEANGGGAARRVQELATARQRALQAKHDYDGHRSGKQDIERSLRDAQKVIAEKGAERDRCQQNVSQQQASLEDLQKNRDRQTNAFKPGTDNLIRAIDRETRWQQKPIGPIGSFVKLMRPEWSSIVESVLGGTLSGFVVFSKQDSDVLYELKRRVKCNADIYIINRQPITPVEPDEQFDTILRILDVQNDYVKKHLIIQNGIEQFILIPDVDEATSTMYDHGRLHHVKGCFAFHPHDKQKGIMLKYTARGDPAQDPVTAYGGQPRMKGDIEATIAARRQNLEAAEAELAVAFTAYQKARAEHQKLTMTEKRHGKRDQDLRIDSQRAEEEVETLQNAIEEDNVESSKLDALKQTLKEHEEAKEVSEQAFKDAINAQDDKKTTLKEKQKALTDANMKVDELQREHDEKKAAHREADQKRVHELREKNHYAARVIDAQRDRQALETNRTESEATLQQFLIDAREMTGSDRINVPEDATIERIKAKHAKLQEDHKRWQRRLGFSADEAATKAAAASKAYAQAKKDLDDLNELRDRNEVSLSDRVARWHHFRRMITARARINFSYLLSERGFRGRLLVNHSKHLLDLAIEPDITRRSNTGRDAKTLSGGEKSFSQICLLLAMWEAMGSPIRCLDEFDVFMDPVNRSMSVRMIIEAARESVGRQYILISPGSKEDYPIARDVKVIDLEAPQRGGGQQRTIDETRSRTIR